MTKIPKTKIAPLLLTALMVASMCAGGIVMAPKAAAQTSPSWTIETVEQGAWGVGNFPSIALDAGDNPHIGYKGTSDSGASYVKYAYKDANGWHSETVDSEGVGFLSLALNASGGAHMSYSGLDGATYVLKYAYRDDAGWQAQTIDTAGGYFSSIALDSAGYPHISYWSTGEVEGNVKYAYEDAEGWHIETVDQSGRYTSIALDAAGNPHIVYDYNIGMSNPSFRYASRDASGWAIEKVEDGVRSSYTSLKFDQAGQPHVSYCGIRRGSTCEIQTLNYATRDKTGWHIEMVGGSSPCSETADSASLALSATGTPHISYRQSSDMALKYAVKGATGWRVETVASGWEGEWSSLALDSAGSPYISWRSDMSLPDHSSVSFLLFASSTDANQPPTANAGPDQIAKAKRTVTLDGSGSSDPDGDSLTYTWTLLEKPDKSKAQLSDVTAAKPTFTADKAGTYKIQLVVTDEHGEQSATDEVIVTAVNKMPK